MVFVLIEDAQHGHVGQKIDGANFYAVDLDAEAFLQIGDEFCTVFRLYEIYVVVFYQFAADIVRSEHVFADPGAADEDSVDDQLFQKGEVLTLSVRYTECDEEEQVSHLADRNAFSTVAHDSENGEQSQGSADAHVCIAS